MPSYLRHFLLLSLAVPLITVQTAWAQEEPDYTRPGFYVGTSAIFVAERNDDFLRNAGDFGIFFSSDNAFGLNVRGGYRVNSFIAVEIEGEYVSNRDSHFTIRDDDDLPQETFDDQHDLLSGTANLKLGIPTGRVQLYGLGGVGFIYNGSENADDFTFFDPDSGFTIDNIEDNDGVGFAVRAGGGVDIFTTEKIVVNVEGTYVIPIGKFEHLDYLTVGIGLRYHF